MWRPGKKKKIHLKIFFLVDFLSSSWNEWWIRKCLFCPLADLQMTVGPLSILRLPFGLAQDSRQWTRTLGQARTARKGQTDGRTDKKETSRGQPDPRVLPHVGDKRGEPAMEEGGGEVMSARGQTSQKLALISVVPFVPRRPPSGRPLSPHDEPGRWGDQAGDGRGKKAEPPPAPIYFWIASNCKKKKRKHVVGFSGGAGLGRFLPREIMLSVKKWTQLFISLVFFFFF